MRRLNYFLKRRAAVLLMLIAILAALMPFGSAEAQNGVYAIRNAKIVTVTGATIERGTVVIRDGKIAAVGDNVPVPSNAKVIDARGMSVYPGLIDSGTTVGLTEIGSIRETQDTTELGDFNPHMKAIVAVHMHSEIIPVTRANGTTTVLTSPRGRLVSGQAALINLDGWTWKEMTLKAPAAMAMEYPSAGGRGRGGFGGFNAQGGQNARRQQQERLESLRKKLEDAQAYAKYLDARAKDRNVPARDTDLVLEALVPVVKGEMPVIMSATRAEDIKGAVELADKYKLKLIIRGADEALEVAALLKEKNVPVIIGPSTDLPRGDDADYDETFSFAGKLHKAGVKFAFQSDNAAYSRSLPYEAGTTAAFGLPKEEALKAITIYPAQIFGVDDLVGSIEVGKIANLIVTDGDPLEFKTNIKHMFINGHPVSLSSKHTELYEKFKNRP